MSSTPPALAIGTDSSDYSRYDSSCSVVTVRGYVAAAHQGMSCAISIARTDGYGVLATVTIPSVGATFSAQFDLNGGEVEDANGVNRAIQGDYLATATLADNTTASVPFTVSLVSVRELRTQWLYGLTTISSEILMPKQQPRTMPVTFAEFSPTFVKDYYGAAPDLHGVVYGLTYNPADSTLGGSPSLAFAGGPAVAITPYAGVQDLILIDKRQADWARVKVDTFQLPAQALVEGIAVDQAQLTDRDFIAQARLATAWAETALGFWVEPRLVISARLKAKYPTYEVVRDGATFYDDFNPNTGVFPDISLPFQFIDAVLDLEGWYNQQKVLTVPQVCIQDGAFSEGNIELVPTSGQASALTWESFPFAFAAMQSKCVPGFWQYACIAGLPSLDGDRGVIRELIAKKAGINLALFAASAYRAGISSRSTSRDNVSFSETYTASAMYSTFAHLTIPWEQWLKDQTPVIRRKIGGIPVVTMR